MTLNIIKTLILYFLSLEYCFCCENCKKIKNNKINNNQNLNNNQKDKEEEEEDNDDNCKNVEIIKNDDVYVKKYVNRVNGEIAKKIYIFENTYSGYKTLENLINENNKELQDGYFDDNYLYFRKDYIGGDIVYALFDKNTNEILCLLTIDDKGNEKITINNIEVQPEKTIYINTFHCYYKYRSKGYGKILMLYVLQQFPKKTGFELAANGDYKLMTRKQLVEIYKKFGFQLSFNDEYNPEKDRNYTPTMAFIKNDDKTYYKDKPVKVIIEER